MLEETLNLPSYVVFLLLMYIENVTRVIQEKYNVFNFVDHKWSLSTMGCILCLLTFYYSFLIVVMFFRKMRANLSENFIKEEYEKRRGVRS